MIERRNPEGVLFLVVGPSGAGKDTLIAAARDTLADDPAFVFARRDITRPADAGGEDHESVSLSTFEVRESAGDYALSWRAHSLCYGVPGSIRAELEAGRHVVVNVSRAVIGAAIESFARVKVVLVTAPESVLRARLIARGREGAADQAHRVKRFDAAIPDNADVIIVDNTGTVANGANALIAALQAGANTAR